MLIMVSLVPLTGWSKQISLAQITFVGAGAFAYLQWAPDLGTSAASSVASLFAVPFGVAMALPALRLQGLYLALASMAFAADGRDPVLPATRDPRVRRQADPADRSILGFDFSQPFDFLGIHFGQDVGTLFFITAALGVVGVLVVWLHKSRFGRRLTALGDSPAACATLGINPIVTKLGVFVISAAIAGFAGALLGIFQGTATVQDFEMLQGLAYLLLLVVGGVAVVSGAVLGGSFLQLFTWLLDEFPGRDHVRSVVLAPRPRPLRHRDRPPALRRHPHRRAKTSAPRTRASGPARLAAEGRRHRRRRRRPVGHRRRRRRRAGDTEPTSVVARR